MALVTLTAHTAGQVLTAAALNNNFNAIVNQVNGSIEAANIAALAVTTAKINTNAVTAAKLDNNLIDDLTLVTAVTTDHVMIADASDSGNLKRALVSDIAPTAATQTQMEAASSNVVMVTPLAVNWHPGVAKAWGVFNGSGTPAFETGGRYNLDATITDNGAGDWTLTFTTDFSTAVYCFLGTARETGSNTIAAVMIDNTYTILVGAIQVVVVNHSGNPADPTTVCIAAFGDQ